MGKAFVLAVVLLYAASSPASAQVAGSAPPPGYEVEEDGTLVIGGDVVVRCSEVGLLGDPGTDDPAVLAQINESVRKSARACESAGFPTAAGPSAGASGSTGAPAGSSASALPSASAPVAAPEAPGANASGAVLPDTGGLPLAGLASLGAALSFAAVAASLALLARR